jgi:hypothetical protein
MEPTSSPQSGRLAKKTFPPQHGCRTASFRFESEGPPRSDDRGGGWALMLAATQPAMALGVAAIAPCVPRLTPSHPNYRRYPSMEPLDTDEGWAKWNVHYWRRDYRGFLEFFFSEQFPESHSTKHIEDCVQWGLDGSAEALVFSDEEAPLPFASEQEARALCRRVRCPVLVVHGELDGCQPRERAIAVAELAGGTLVTLGGAGHLPQARHPVKVNRLLREFAASVAPPPVSIPWSGWPRARSLALRSSRWSSTRSDGDPSGSDQAVTRQDGFATPQGVSLYQLRVTA